MTRELDDDLLQRYYDGELSPVEERSVRNRVDADPAAQLRLKKLAQLSEALQGAARQMGGEVDADALFAGISAGIAKDRGRGAPGKLEVISQEWVEHKRQLWVPLAAAGAIAAAALLAVLTSGDRDAAQLAKSTTPDATQEQAPATRDVRNPVLEPESQAVASREADARVHGSEVEQVDFGSNAGTVFAIETRGMTTAVVWITDDFEGDVQ